MIVWEQEISDTVYTAIVRAADQYNVPRSLMLALSKFEAGFRSDAVGDNGCSIGLFQLNTCGGVGQDYNVESLKDPTLNSQIAAHKLMIEYAKFGNWWEASWPWSVRPIAFQWLKDHGEVIDQSGEPTKPTTPNDRTILSNTQQPLFTADLFTQTPIVIGIFAALLLVGILSLNSKGSSYGY